LLFYTYIELKIPHIQSKLGDFLFCSRKVTFPYLIAKFVFNDTWVYRSSMTIVFLF